MALIRCPDCGREISTEAPSCPGCGRPMQTTPKPTPVDQQPTGHLLNATPLEAWGCLYPMLAIFVIILLIALFH